MDTLVLNVSTRPGISKVYWSNPSASIRFRVLQAYLGLQLQQFAQVTLVIVLLQGHRCRLWISKNHQTVGEQGFEVE
jgi:hypothetical protein